MEIPGYEAFIDEITTFLSKPLRPYAVSQWIESDQNILRVYLRIKLRWLNNQGLQSIDIANIQVRSQWQRQGHGTALIDQIHTINPLNVTYVENAHHPGLRRWLERSDWIKENGLIDRSLKPVENRRYVPKRLGTSTIRIAHACLTTWQSKLTHHQA